MVENSAKSSINQSEKPHGSHLMSRVIRMEFILVECQTFLQRGKRSTSQVNYLFIQVMQKKKKNVSATDIVVLQTSIWDSLGIALCTYSGKDRISIKIVEILQLCKL